ncbi:MAG: transporter [Hyphomicrobiaceae bacterium]
MAFYRILLTAFLLLGSFLADAVRSEEKDLRPAAGLQDNSFLIEEAYNQERGVVQHISTLRRQGRDWFLNFTQEWPIGNQTHQFSYGVPYAWLGSEAERTQGLGDLQLNYRYQLSTETAARPAIAPRLTLILPTGDEGKGLGAGSLGYQVNLPVSKIVSDRVTLHFNAGVTSYSDVGGHQPTSYNLGGSIVYAVTRETNFLLETVAEWNEAVTPSRDIEREFALTLLPGVRHAINLPEGQLVLGLGAPIRFSEGAVDYGALFYVSFEHSFLR